MYARECQTKSGVKKAVPFPFNLLIDEIMREISTRHLEDISGKNFEFADNIKRRRIACNRHGEPVQGKICIWKIAPQKPSDH